MYRTLCKHLTFVFDHALVCPLTMHCLAMQGRGPSGRTVGSLAAMHQHGSNASTQHIYVEAEPRRSSDIVDFAQCMEVAGSLRYNLVTLPLQPVEDHQQDAM